MDRLYNTNKEEEDRTQVIGGKAGRKQTSRNVDNIKMNLGR
jgi:hypothetical protein